MAQQLGSIPVREGDLLAGKYRVSSVLGSGGMGIVVAARHEQLDQLVALKFVRDEALGNVEAVERFLREARAAAKLKSEHAAKVLDVGTLESGAPYMVMEYLEGSDLGQVLAERGKLSVELAAEWVMQACEAVAEAHAAGIVHRDLKPQNLFLARTVGGASKVKVLDFGVSKSMSPTSGGVAGLTQTRAMLGSPLYMAPEQMRSSRDVDARADVWALGVVLFELLTQRWPFEAETMPDLCLKVVGDPPLSLAGLRPDVSRQMVDVVERCLRKEPAERFANAAELASALEGLVPPASRVVAARARLAMGISASAPAVVVAQTMAAPLDARPRPSRRWIVIGAVGAVAAAALIVGARFAGAPASARLSAASAASTASAAAVTAAPDPASPPAIHERTNGAVVLQAPAATVAPAATEVTPAVSTAVSSAPAPASSAPKLPARVAPSPSAPPHVAPGKKPGGHDDDIPSFR